MANAYSKELSFRTVLSSYKLSSNQDVLQKQNQPQAPRKPFRLPVLNHLLASVFKWCKQLARDPYKGKNNKIKLIYFDTVPKYGLVNNISVPKLARSIFVWLECMDICVYIQYIHIYIYIDRQCENFSP